ncbi:MAG: hypothetical protein ACHQF0_03230 [Chitinophagales bacterium]
MKYLFLFFLLSPLFGSAQVGDTYKNYLHSDFADFFHTSEIKRTPYKKGELREIKTGGFQDYITIYIYADTVSMIIHEATLEIDREWMEEENTADLSRDLVKSFLLDFIAKADQPKAMAAGDLLFNRKTTQDKFALDVQDVFNDKKDSLAQQFTKCTVRLENFKQDEKNYLRLKISENSQ